MGVTATDELRRMLDERGVEWRERVWGGKHSVTTFWRARGVRWHYRENRFGELRLHADGLAPEQAIEATLDSCNCSNSERTGTCRITVNGPWGYPYVCNACGASFDADVINGDFNYCPNCGRRVEQ